MHREGCYPVCSTESKLQPGLVLVFSFMFKINLIHSHPLGSIRSSKEHVILLLFNKRKVNSNSAALDDGHLKFLLVVR